MMLGSPSSLQPPGDTHETGTAGRGGHRRGPAHRLRREFAWPGQHHQDRTPAILRLPSPPAARPGRPPPRPPTALPVAPGAGALPQTRALPSTNSAAFRAAMQDLWLAVTTGKPDLALPAFFPLTAYQQVKAIYD